MTDAAVPEFSRTVAIDRIGSTPQHHPLSASEAECAALARRFALVRLDRLAATLDLRALDTGWEAIGRIDADVVQSCIASGADVPAHVTDSFALRFLPAHLFAQHDEDTEFGADDCDVIAVPGGQIDLGEAVAQTLALALDPFPRAPDADDVLRTNGVMTEEEAASASSPFAALKDLAGGRDRR